MIKYSIITILFLFFIVFSSDLHAEEEDSYVGVLFYPTSYEEYTSFSLKFFSQDKKSCIELSRNGLFLDDIKICSWGTHGLGADYSKDGFTSIDKDSCPNDTLIKRFHGFEPGNIHYTGIRIKSIKDGVIEIPYKGKVYSGDLGTYQFKIFPAKGSELEKQVKADYEKLVADRRKELKDIGLADTLNALKKCLVPKVESKDCFINYLPAGDDKFSIALEPGEDPKEYDLEELYKRLSEYDTDFVNCIKQEGPKFNFNYPDRDKITTYVNDGEWDWGEYCTFEQKNGIWIFTGIGWAGC